MAGSFSERYGFVKVSDAIQIGSINTDTRTAIWSLLYVNFFKLNHVVYDNEALMNHILVGHLNFPADELPYYERDLTNKRSFLTMMKFSFMRDEWYFVFDIIEQVLLIGADHYKIYLSDQINSVFRKYNLGYTLINGLITPISNETEVDSIQNAINNSGNASSSQHLKRALELMVDREQPDYRNSIKESISAIESLCKNITGDDKGTLGKCLIQVEKKHYIHPAMKQAFSQLFGYASDQSGIRHSLKDGEQEPTLEDARFMLIACSAFSNYLLSIVSE